MRLFVLIALCLLCSDSYIGTAQETEGNGCNSSAPILNTDDGTCREIPDPESFTVITDSTSYTVILPLSEVAGLESLVQLFTIYLSPKEDMQINNLFIFTLQGLGGYLSSFFLQTNSEGPLSPGGVQKLSNALFTAKDNNLEVGIYVLTLLVTPINTPSLEVADFTVKIVEDLCVGSTGSGCEEFQMCATIHPCQNGGTCLEGPGVVYLCLCSKGFDGENCEIDIDLCEFEPCNNGGTCIDGYGLAFNCTCADGFFGINCTQDISECDESAPCQNGGTCSDGPGLNYACLCPEGFDGDNCEIDIDVCSAVPCSNGGTCTDGYGLAFSCTCPDGYFGTNCTEYFVGCNESVPCQNGGTCSDEPGHFNYTCTCPEGFDGKKCENDINSCHSKPCSNGGTCTDGYGLEFTCLCDEGFEGVTCETDVNACQSDPCKNGGCCQDLPGPGLGFSCVCVSGFSGLDCSMDLDICSDICNETDCEYGFWLGLSILITFLTTVFVSSLLTILITSCCCQVYRTQMKTMLPEPVLLRNKHLDDTEEGSLLWLPGASNKQEQPQSAAQTNGINETTVL